MKTIKLLKIPILFIFLILIFNCKGQPLATNENRTQEKIQEQKININYKKEDVVRAALQDSSGKIWFATTNEGVFRYDGETLSDFTNKPNNTNSVSIVNQKLSKDNEPIDTSPRVDSILQFTLMITSIFQDSKGHFWFGTHGDGLCRYDGKEYTYFTVGHGLPSGIDREFAPGPDWSKTRKINGGNQIGSIQEDKEGNILYNNGETKVCKFNGQAFSIIEPEQKSFLSTTKSDKEWKADLDCLWFGSSKLRVYRYDGNKLSHLSFPPAYSGERDGVSAVYKDNEGNLWFGTMGNGTFRYDGKSFTPIFGKDEIGISRSIFQDNTGRIWLSNNSIGLYYMEGDTLTNFGKEYSLQNPNEPKAGKFITGFQTIEQDENDDLWFGTFSSGLWRYDGKQLNHYTNEGSLPIVTVKTIYKDKSGKLWFGIGEGTVYGFDGRAFYRFDEAASNR